MRVPRTAPGDVVRVRVRRRKAGVTEGILLDLVQPSPLRIAPRCAVFGSCGGCVWQHLPYVEQLRFKQDFVRQALGLPEGDARLLPIVPSPDPWQYRNKMEFTFGQNGHGLLVCGLHKPGTWWEVLPVPYCHIMPEPANAVIRFVEDDCRARGLDAYNPRTHQGLLRHLVFRWSRAQQAMIVVLFTGHEDFPNFTRFAEALQRACPWVIGVHWCVNPGRGDAATFHSPMARYGAAHVEERLDDLVFSISPQSFFQSNPAGAERLYRIVRDLLDLDAHHVLLDAFCGAGTIAQLCARHCRQVVGIELVPEAVEDARISAARNGITNCTFLAGRARDLVRRLTYEEGWRFDRLVLDPPRSGIDNRSLKAICSAHVPLLVYVSCNLSALERDLGVLAAAGYRLTRACAVDLFPQTAHIETVVQLRL